MPQLVERKGLFGAMDLEVSVWGWLALLLQACNEAAYCGREHMLEANYSRHCGCRRRRGGDKGFSVPFEDTPECLKSPTGRGLKFPQLSSNTTGSWAFVRRVTPILQPLCETDLQTRRMFPQIGCVLNGALYVFFWNCLFDVFKMSLKASR